ncbi:hypothetical protein CYCD_00190 [Tenuifilaceae bacterium CYCD]|nr:hypothetical protein CYCD_00190 [Tenuifilaceae bacterium CYCD]
MILVKKISILISIILSLNLSLAAQSGLLLIDSIENETNNAKLDTVSLNKILKRLDERKIRGLTQTDSIAQIILNRFKSINYNDGVDRTIHLLATLNYKRGNFKHALEYHKELLNNLEQKNTNPHLKANVYRFMTGEYFNMGLFDTAIVFGKKAISEFQHLKDTQNIASCLNLLGGIYWNKGNLKKASEKLYESLKIKEKLKDTLGVANAYNNIGLIYDSQGKLDDAIEMYSKALEVYIKVKDSQGDQGFGRACNNIAVSKKNQGKYSESLEMFMKSLEIDKKQKNIDELGKTLNNIGLLYLELNDVSKGIEYFNQAYEALCQSGNENGIAAVYINLGKAYLLQKRYSKAESYYQKGLELAKKIASNEWQRDSYEGLYEVSKALGNTNSALAFHENYMTLDDSLRKVENLNKLDQLKIEYETEQKEKEIVLLSKDKELNELKLKKQESYSHFLLTIIVSAIIILVLSYLHVHRLNTDKKILLHKNKEITQQKEEIETQRDLLESTNAELNQQKEELIAQSEQIEKQNKFISGIHNRMTESIEYASLIQQTLLPNTSIFNKYFKNHFVIYKPKDIVSGDLYWAWEKNNDIIFAVADCTGHGVAGAFVSVMVISTLKDAVGVRNLNEPKEISAYLHGEMVKNSYSTLNSIIGVDFIVCKYSPQTKELSYSGNHMNFIIANNENVEVIKANRITQIDANSNYTENFVKLSSNDKLYFYTDGYTDQLSGVKRKKMGRSELIKLVSSTIIQPYHLQEETIDSFYNKWKGTFEQVDDVLVLGLEV